MTMESLFKGYRLPEPTKDHRTERGDLLDYFLSVLNPDRQKKGMSQLTHAFLNTKLQGIPTPDLYVLQKKMQDAARKHARNHRSIPASAIFWVETRAKRPESGVTLK